MWTPRRILLLLLGLAGSLSAYVVYAAALGGVDGLPDLPDKLLVPAPSDQEFKFPDQPISPTYLHLQQAFGPTSDEVLDTITYKIRLEKRDQGLVFACGQMEFDRPASKLVSVSPLSVAFFGKEKPDHLKQPGEVQEISTFHSDKAVLQFDRPVGGPQDLDGKTPAKLIGMELVSVPDMPSRDVRRGQVWITNNQKAADPGQFLVFRTPGPLFYRDADAASPDAPQVWTAAAVEVVDRKNLPRPLRSGSTATAQVRGDEFRARNAVADVLLGVTLPPPTMTAEGMKIYLDRQDTKTPTAKRNNTGYSGVRTIELVEKVQVNLWSDGGGGFPGSAPPQEAKPAAVDPPAAFATVAGGAAADGAAIARRFEDKTLLVIQTLGPFRYDFAASRAKFEAAAVTPEAVPNHVTVARHSARGTQDNLFCKVLEIDFLDSKEKAAEPKQPAAKDRPQPDQGGMRIKSLTATGPYVYVSVEAEKLQAQGTELRYVTDAKTRRSDTTLRGNPVIAVRDRNRLEGGNAATPAEIFISSIAPAPGSKDRKQTKLEVRGGGTIKMFDPATNDTTLTATWGKSLTHEKVKVGDIEQDLLKFEGGGTFEDRKGAMTLSGDRLWLWLAPGDGKSDAQPVAAATVPGNDLSKSLPQRLQAVGHVRSQSPELVIHDTDLLNVWFRDVPPPPPEPPPPAVAKADPKPAAAGPTAEPPLAGKPPEKKDEPTKAKHPVNLSARVIESWVVRYPQKGLATKADPKAEQTTLRYELEKARCEDRVVVHQDPDDPLKNPRGLDIAGAKLNLDATRAGSVMTVTGTAQAPAEVHFESITLYGPAVVIDQPTNAVAVDGIGWLLMPAQSDPYGNAPARPSELKVAWTQSMRFFGAKARAEFYGQVQAVQQLAGRPGGKPETAPVPRASAYRPDPAVSVRPGPPPDDGSRPESWVLCHRLDVTFDRPVYFNNSRRQGPKAAGDENPRLKTAQCTPMPADEAAKLPPRNRELAQRVFYIESLTKDGKVIKAQRINAEQIDLTNDADKREQQVIATGPGDVRILQFGAKEALGQPAPAAAPGRKAPPAEQEMKLTLVKFPSRMVATDKGKLYQEAVFDDGGRVWQVPTTNLNFDEIVIEQHPPARTVFLECTQRLTVSSSKVRPDATAEQRLTAVGNAMFRDDKYQGNAHTIQDDGRVTTLTGSDQRMAHLYQRQRTVNEQPYSTGRQFKYYRDGHIEGAGSGSGNLQRGP
ncbi:MAG TPA: hypothetical protein VFG68_14195 [Fimbriiglobus sp.]|nr:hypothetical protein [Fimbriiglobus sp.]